MRGRGFDDGLTCCCQLLKVQARIMYVQIGARVLINGNVYMI